MARSKAKPRRAGPRAGDQREAQRFTLILRAGKLITASGEYLVVLRDVSSGGIKVRLFHQLPEPGSCEIELASGARYGLECVWQDSEHLGLRFVDAPVDISQLLEESGPFPKRQLRLHLAQPPEVKLYGAGPPVPTRLRDISQHGAAIDCDERLAIGQHLALAAPLLGEIDARVRWRRGNRYGLVFQQGFRLDELARLSASLQTGGKGHEFEEIAVHVNI